MKRLTLLLALLLAPALAHAQLEPFQAFPPDQTVFSGGVLTSAICTPNGTNAAPSYYFCSNADTGIYYPETGLWGSMVGGATAGFGFSVDSSLIGSITDVGFELYQPLVLNDNTGEISGVELHQSANNIMAVGVGAASLDIMGVGGPSSTNSERLRIGYGAVPNQITFSSLASGTGTVRDFAFVGGDVSIPDGPVVAVIASGALAFDPGSTNTDTCAAAITDTATGTLTTDVISWTFSADPTSTTGYDPSGDLGYIVAYPTADTVNFKFCNKSGAAIDPTSVTLNWRVDR